eukprot:10350909-Alexandrium_andersonii.AAC.1
MGATHREAKEEVAGARDPLRAALRWRGAGDKPVGGLARDGKEAEARTSGRRLRASAPGPRASPRPPRQPGRCPRGAPAPPPGATPAPRCPSHPGPRCA